ncbi:MAG: putative zinc-binding protein [Candidatus Bathyarchaeia archaeon]
MAKENEDKILIIPCSGIGKPSGTISRTATYYVVEDLLPKETDTVCLALLVIGDEKTRQRVQQSHVIAVDGCPAKCATKGVQASNGRLATSLNVLQLYRNHIDLEVKSVVDLGPEGEKFARIVAGKILEEIGKIRREQNV